MKKERSSRILQLSGNKSLNIKLIKLFVTRKEKQSIRTVYLVWLNV